MSSQTREDIVTLENEVKIGSNLVRGAIQSNVNNNRHKYLHLQLDPKVEIVNFKNYRFTKLPTVMTKITASKNFAKITGNTITGNYRWDP